MPKGNKKNLGVTTRKITYNKKKDRIEIEFLKILINLPAIYKFDKDSMFWICDVISHEVLHSLCYIEKFNEVTRLEKVWSKHEEEIVQRMTGLK